MTHDDAPVYGLWMLVILNSAVLIFFAFSFGKPRTPRDWRSFSAFSAFIVALFAEMYGFPLTIYLLSRWLQARYPGIDPMGLSTAPNRAGEAMPRTTPREVTAGRVNCAP